VSKSSQVDRIKKVTRKLIFPPGEKRDIVKVQELAPAKTTMVLPELKIEKHEVLTTILSLY
jgi:hypothetical protein